jgi:hypothetical protein
VSSLSGAFGGSGSRGTRRGAVIERKKNEGRDSASRQFGEGKF